MAPSQHGHSTRVTSARRTSLQSAGYIERCSPERSWIVAGDDACRSCRCEAGAGVDTKGDGVIVALIIICEVAFWVLLVGGLALRYVAEAPRAGAAVLLCEPLLELVLLVVTAIDLRNGAEPDWKHGLAAVYIGFTVTFGHYTIKWADGQVPPPLRGRAAARQAAAVREGAGGARVDARSAGHGRSGDRCGPAAARGLVRGGRGAERRRCATGRCGWRSSPGSTSSSRSRTRSGPGVPRKCRQGAG